MSCASGTLTRNTTRSASARWTVARRCEEGAAGLWEGNAARTAKTSPNPDCTRRPEAASLVTVSVNGNDVGVANKKHQGPTQILTSDLACCQARVFTARYSPGARPGNTTAPAEAEAVVEF